MKPNLSIKPPAIGQPHKFWRPSSLSKPTPPRDVFTPQNRGVTQRCYPTNQEPPGAAEPTPPAKKIPKLLGADVNYVDFLIAQGIPREQAQECGYWMLILRNEANKKANAEIRKIQQQKEKAVTKTYQVLNTQKEEAIKKTYQDLNAQIIKLQQQKEEAVTKTYQDLNAQKEEAVTKTYQDLNAQMIKLQQQKEEAVARAHAQMLKLQEKAKDSSFRAQIRATEYLTVQGILDARSALNLIERNERPKFSTQREYSRRDLWTLIINSNPDLADCLSNKLGWKTTGMATGEIIKIYDMLSKTAHPVIEAGKEGSKIKLPESSLTNHHLIALKCIFKAFDINYEVVLKDYLADIPLDDTPVLAPPVATKAGEEK